MNKEILFDREGCEKFSKERLQLFSFVRGQIYDDKDEESFVNLIESGK